MRVRLINPIIVWIARLDTAATKAVAGYDPDFNETNVALVNGVRTVARREKELVKIRAQFEDDTMDRLNMGNTGDAPTAKSGTVLDYTDIRRQGLVDPETGEADFNVGDRLVAIYNRCGGLIQQVRTPPGLYAVEVRPMSIGLADRVNLLLIRWNDRELGTQQT